MEIRLKSLEMSLFINSDGCAAHVVEEAKVIEAYLRGPGCDPVVVSADPAYEVEPELTDAQRQEAGLGDLRSAKWFPVLESLEKSAALNQYGMWPLPTAGHSSGQEGLEN